jgi:EmrB/QacA subfamily drug resistance transporter
MKTIEQSTRLYTLAGIGLAMFLGALDQTIVSTALPTIVNQLNGLNRYTWIATVYLLVSTLLVPIYGRLSDTISRKSLELWSITVFLIGSILSGMAGEFGTLPLLGDGMTQLIVFRGIQGIGGAGIFALAFIIISDLYAPRERGKISGLLGGIFGLASILGPVFGGFLTDSASNWIPGIAGWRWVFYVNVPIGAVALWFIITKMPRLHPKDDGNRVDFVSAFLMIAAFFPLILALELDKNSFPWGGPVILGLFGFSIAMLGLWILQSLKSNHPILNLRLFKNRVFSIGTAAVFFFGGNFMSLIIFLPLYMVNVQGVSATRAGVSIIPLSLGMVLGSGFAGPLVSRLGKYKATLLVGSAISLLASILMITLGVDSPYWVVVVFMVVAGLGFGPAQSLYSLAIQNSVSDTEIGQATSFIQFSRQIGSTIGAAIMGTIFAASLATAFALHMPAADDTAAPAGMQQSSAGSAAGSAFSNKGPEEMRAEINSSFDQLTRDITSLFDARGEEALGMLSDVLAEPTLPAEFRSQLADGTPAMQISSRFQQLADAVNGMVLSGDQGGLNALLSDPHGAGNTLPAAAVEGILVLSQAPPAARAAGLERIDAQLNALEKQAVDSASSTALAGALEGLNSARQAALDAVEVVRASFADAIRSVWTVAIVLATLTLIASILLPSLELRGKGESRGPEPSAPMAAQ